MKKLNKTWVSVFTHAEDSDGNFLFDAIETRVLIENGAFYGADNLRPRFLTAEDFIRFLHAIATEKDGVWTGSAKWKQDELVDSN